MRRLEWDKAVEELGLDYWRWGEAYCHGDGALQRFTDVVLKREEHQFAAYYHLPDDPDALEALKCQAYLLMQDYLKGRQ